MIGALAEYLRDSMRVFAACATNDQIARVPGPKSGVLGSLASFQPFAQPMPLFNQSIRRKIVGIALGLIVLMLVTSILSMVMSSQVGVLLDELTNRYIPAYGDLARANIRSLERALALRRVVMTKMQSPSDEDAYAARLRGKADAPPNVLPKACPVHPAVLR